MNSQELFEQISGLFETAKENHAETSKAAKGRARKALSEMKKVIAEIGRAHV